MCHIHDLRALLLGLFFFLAKVCHDITLKNHSKLSPEVDCHSDAVKREANLWIQRTELGVGIGVLITASGYGVLSDRFGASKSVSVILLTVCWLLQRKRAFRVEPGQQRRYNRPKPRLQPAIYAPVFGAPRRHLCADRGCITVPEHRAVRDP